MNSYDFPSRGAGRADRRLAAAGLVAFVAASVVAYVGLALVFDFPQVLRRTPAEILAAFRARQGEVVAFYELFALAHFWLAAVVVILARALALSVPAASDEVRPGGDRLAPGLGPAATLACFGGLVYALAQTAGFLRWPILVPVFAAASEPDLALLGAFHQYAGVAIGEHLSFLGMALWLTGLGATLAGPAFGQLGLGRAFLAIGALAGLYALEQLGGAFSALAPLLIVVHGVAYALLLVLARRLWRADAREGSLEARAGALGRA